MCKQPDDCNGVYNNGHCPLLEEAADRAVRKVFAILGVDVNSPEKVEEFREDLRFGRTLRRASDRGVLTVVTTIAGALVLAAWYGIVSRFGP